MISAYTVGFHADNGTGDYEEKEMNIHGVISIGHEILIEGEGGPEWKVFAVVHDLHKTILHVK